MDIFDEVAAEQKRGKPKGDIFDRVAAEMKTPASSASYSGASIGELRRLEGEQMGRTAPPVRRTVPATSEQIPPLAQKSLRFANLPPTAKGLAAVERARGRATRAIGTATAAGSAINARQQKAKAISPRGQANTLIDQMVQQENEQARVYAKDHPILNVAGKGLSFARNIIPGIAADDPQGEESILTTGVHLLAGASSDNAQDRVFREELAKRPLSQRMAVAAMLGRGMFGPSNEEIRRLEIAESNPLVQGLEGFAGLGYSMPTDVTSFIPGVGLANRMKALPAAVRKGANVVGKAGAGGFAAAGAKGAYDVATDPNRPLAQKVTEAGATALLSSVGAKHALSDIPAKLPITETTLRSLETGKLSGRSLGALETMLKVPAGTLQGRAIQQAAAAEIRAAQQATGAKAPAAARRVGQQQVSADIAPDRQAVTVDASGKPFRSARGMQVYADEINKLLPESEARVDVIRGTYTLTVRKLPQEAPPRAQTSPTGPAGPPLATPTTPSAQTPRPITTAEPTASDTAGRFQKLEIAGPVQADPALESQGLAKVATVKPEEIGVLPGMQYKRAGITDPVNAVSDLLKDVSVFDVDQAGIVTAFQSNDGRLWAVNGHHRIELAKRAKRFVSSGPSGQVDVPRGVKVRILDEADGWTMEKARGLGALENIRDAKGTAIDAISVMQDLGISPEQFRQHGIGLSSKLARDMRGLYGLEPSSLGRVQAGDLQESAAAGIGSVRGLSEKAQHGAIDEAAGRGVESYEKARRLAEMYLEDEQSGALAEDLTGDLFGGEFKSATSTRGLRVEIEDAIRRRLRNERSSLLQPVGAELRQGEYIDATGRKAEAERLGGTGRELKDRLDLVFRNFQDIKAQIAQLATEVGSGRKNIGQATEEVLPGVRTAAQATVRDLVAGRPLSEPGGARGEAAELSREAAQGPDLFGDPARGVTRPTGAAEPIAPIALYDPGKTGKGFLPAASNFNFDGFDPNSITRQAQQVLGNDLRGKGYVWTGTLKDGTHGTWHIRYEDDGFGRNAPITAEPVKPSTGNSGTMELFSGLDPRAVVKMADNLDIPPGGSFTVARKPTDAGGWQYLRSPLSIVDAFGKTIQTGYYERIGGPIGKEASQQIRSAQQRIEAHTRKWQQAVDSVENRITKGIGRLNHAARDTAASDFVTLVERDKDDPLRRGSTPEQQKALEDHDALTEEFRNYIIDQRKALGVPMPSTWGVTEKGYFRHLFLGDIRVLDGGRTIGYAPTYAEAQKIAIDHLKTHPGANVTAIARDLSINDPTLRLSTRKFWKTVANLADSAHLSKADILEDINGVVGRASMRTKFLGALLQRKGARGYSRNYGDVMRLHAHQVARSQELSRLNRSLVPMIERLKDPNDLNLPGLAEHMEGHLSHLWGTPTPMERNIGRMIEATPVLRNHVASPALAMRATAQKLTALQSLLKLDVNPKSAAVNVLQPFSTLWPYVSTREFVGLYKEYLKPSTRQMLRDRGVFEGATKLEGADSVVARRTASPFRAASAMNRGIGYLFGYRQAMREAHRVSLLAEDAPAIAHANGLAWAEKVEFDNSQWNAPPILRTPQGRILGQFKGFTVKNWETIGNMATKQAGETRSAPAKRVGKLALAQTAVGGLRSGGMLTTVVGGYAIYKALEAQLVKHGMTKEDAEKTASAVYYGAPSLIGTDLSGSVSIAEPAYGRTLKEQVVNFFGGPNVESAISLWDGIEKIRSAASGEKREAVEALVKRMTPLGRTAEGIGQRLSGDLPTIKVPGKKPLVLTPGEALLRDLGFVPVRQSRFYDERESAPKAFRPVDLDLTVLTRRALVQTGVALPAVERGETEPEAAFEARRKRIGTIIDNAVQEVFKDRQFTALEQPVKQHHLERIIRTIRQNNRAPKSGPPAWTRGLEQSTPVRRDRPSGGGVIR